jgi:hypothetical protein
MVEDVEAGRVTIHAAPFQPTTGGAHPPPMIRVAVYHSTHVPADTAKWKPCFARLALLVVADRCDGEGCAAALGKAVSRAAAGAVASWDPRTQAWSVSVHGATAAGPGPNLLVSRGPSPRDMSRQVDGKEMVFAPLVVNGAPVSLGH